MTILSAAPRALADPNDYHARADLMWAGMLAHNNLSGVGRAHDWASHQIGQELSALYDCAHGASLSVVTPVCVRYVMERNPMRFPQFAVRVFGCRMDFQHPENTAKEGIRQLKAWIRVLGLPQTLQDVGGRAEDILRTLDVGGKRMDGVVDHHFHADCGGEVDQYIALFDEAVKLNVIDSNIQLNDFQVRIFRNCGEIFPRTGGKIIRNHNRVTCIEQSFRQITADEPGSAGD
jgi:hypothetical protein